MAQDIRPILDRLDRLERDLNQVQRQVYRSQVGGGPAPVVPPSVDNGASVDVSIRMDQLEEQMRRLTGQLEEIQNNITQLGTRLDKKQADDEVRFQALEGHGGGGGQDIAAAAPSRGAADMDRPPSASGQLVGPRDGGSPSPANAGPNGGLPSGSAQEQYSYAFGLVRQQDFKNAELALKSFLQKHPSDPLAGNAQFWLGQTYFVRGDNAAAASTFAEGYQKFPQGQKASESLLKLGISLNNLGRKQDACASFARLDRDFPKLEQSIKDTEVQERRKAGC
ncbi:MAG TPA: tol-pal system protein YbgF [Aliidongia sp.]|nr:tol-pal system protein YbgF [Aliidongia sp.]